MIDNNPVQVFVKEVQDTLSSGQAREHGYRPSLERLMSSFVDTLPINDPKRSEHGNPDFIFLKRSNQNIILGYAEAKDLSIALDKVETTEQMHRYAGYDNLFLTNCLEFRFFRNGVKYQTISIGKMYNGQLHFEPNLFNNLKDELGAFLELPPEKIKSGVRLAQIMGAKARRIRDNVSVYLSKDQDEKNQDLRKIYKIIRQLLVHDLSAEKFADMYAQTLVYGLFVARYNDTSPDFSRSKARELVPASNPFLREFFDHIVGPHFDKRLSYIVDELCEVFSVSDIKSIVHKHLKITDMSSDEKDPIIHFYEDFLNEYDPVERKLMGAYYTPVPVVRFIVRQVDEILKHEFSLSKGLADISKITREIDHGQELQLMDKKTGRLKKTNIEQRDFHKVQILDPAVGTATFLNETILHIYKTFKGQEGRWSSYVESDLLPRLSGFEVMMAPYTIAHLKLGMTIQETGAKDISQRLGIYLTNTLEEGVPRQQNLFDIGLTAVVTEESQLASEIKHERPIMVVMGNPPYSVSSNNRSDYIQNLIKDYKKDLFEKKINLDDDYIKFIRFAEEMIDRNGEGIMAMITNNSYIDGITHRQMRKHLMQTFDKIYILDLHGSSKKKEITPDGNKDENVFDIMQGVSIILAVKTKNNDVTARTYHAELFGKRHEKFNKLDGVVNWTEIFPSSPRYYFTNKNFYNNEEYQKDSISLEHLFIKRTSGIETQKDSLVVQFNESSLLEAQEAILEDEDAVRARYKVLDSRDWTLEAAKNDIINSTIEDISYRVFDKRKILYSPNSKGVTAYPRYEVMKNLLKPNIALNVTSKNRGLSQGYCLVSNTISDRHLLDSASDSMQTFPLYIYHEDGSKTSNFKINNIKLLLKNLQQTYTPEDILYYIYAMLYSPSYREKYKEFLKIDFPRIPAPVNDTEFHYLVTLGKSLCELHLMKSPILDTLDTNFPEGGTNEVENVQFDDSKVRINRIQYFGKIPEGAWNFYIGGYQPAQKWLKDRKGRKLSNTDIEHYQKIIKVLIETGKVMKRIDDYKLQKKL